MAYGLSNGHVTDDVTWPWKVKLVTPIYLEHNISKTTWARDFKFDMRLCIGNAERVHKKFPWKLADGRNCYSNIARCIFTARCTLVQSAVLRSHVVYLSVCPSVCLSVTLANCDHIGWNSSKLISPLVSLGRSLFATPTWRGCSKGNTPKFGPKVTHHDPYWFERRRHSIANCGRMVRDSAKVTMESL